MLFSPEPNGDCLSKLNWGRPEKIHISGSFGLNIGNFLTATEVGLSISNLHFKERDGNNNFNLEIGEKSRWFWTSGFRLRYILHNSSLGGFGIVQRPNPDLTEDLPSDNYFLRKDEISKWMFFFDTSIAYRMNNITFFYKLSLHTKEFHKTLSEPIYGWGTIGLSFNRLSRIKKLKK